MSETDKRYTCYECKRDVLESQVYLRDMIRDQHAVVAVICRNCWRLHNERD